MKTPSQNQLLQNKIAELQAQVKALQSAQKPEVVKVDPAIKQAEIIGLATKVYAEVCKRAQADTKNPVTGYYASFTGGVIIKKAISKYGSYKAADELKTAQTILKAAKEYAII